MKLVLLLACLVPLALAREKEALSACAETLDSTSSSEEYFRHKQKLQQITQEEQQQRQDEPQAPAPYAAPEPYAVPVPSILSVPQPVVAPALPPLLQPEVMANLHRADPAPFLSAAFPVPVPVPVPGILGQQIPVVLGPQIPQQPLLAPAGPQLPGVVLLPGHAQPIPQTHEATGFLQEFYRALQQQQQQQQQLALRASQQDSVAV